MPSEGFKPTSMREFFSQPSQMLFWGKPEKLVEFLLVQAEHHLAGGSWESGKALEDCAKKLIEIYELDKEENE